MTVELNKVAIQVAELKKDLDALTDKASRIFELIGDEDDKVACSKSFIDGIYKAEVALEDAAKWVQTEVIISLTYPE